MGWVVHWVVLQVHVDRVDHQVERVLAAAPPVERDVEEEELRPGPFRTCPGANHPDACDILYYTCFGD